MACEESLDQFSACWEGLEDPRSGNAGLHDFHELLVIALCAVLSGGQGAVDMALFAKAKEPFLRGFLKLENEMRLPCAIPVSQDAPAHARVCLLF